LRTVGRSCPRTSESGSRSTRLSCLRRRSHVSPPAADPRQLLARQRCARPARSRQTTSSAALSGRGSGRRASASTTCWFQFRQRRIPHLSRRRSPEAPAGTRKSPQDNGRKGLLAAGIPAYPRSGRKCHDRTVTPEVAGSSPGLSRRKGLQIGILCCWIRHRARACTTTDR
jgi:hypothetical protein